METQLIQSKIYTLRGQRVMFDFDLAELYEVETRALKQTVRRNTRRFPLDFMFELTENEMVELGLCQKSKGVNARFFHQIMFCLREI